MDQLIDTFEDRAAERNDWKRVLSYKWLRSSQPSSFMEEIDALEAIHYRKESL